MLLCWFECRMGILQGKNQRDEQTRTAPFPRRSQNRRSRHRCALLLPEKPPTRGVITRVAGLRVGRCRCGCTGRFTKSSPGGVKTRNRFVRRTPPSVVVVDAAAARERVSPTLAFFTFSTASITHIHDGQTNISMLRRSFKPIRTPLARSRERVFRLSRPRPPRSFFCGNHPLLRSRDGRVSLG